MKHMMSNFMGTYNSFQLFVQVIVYERPRHFVKNHINAFQNSKILYHLDLQPYFVCYLEWVSGVGGCYQSLSQTINLLQCQGKPPLMNRFPFRYFLSIARNKGNKPDI